MKILCGFPAARAWADAARFLGHAAAPLDYEKAVLQFDQVRPEVVLVDSGLLPPAGRSPVAVGLLNHPGVKFAVLGRRDRVGSFPRPHTLLVSLDQQCASYHLRPATTFLPDFPGGTARDEFRCDLLVTSDPTPDRMVVIDNALADGRRVKIFSPTRWPYPEYLGRLTGRDRVDAFASADLWANFADDWAAMDAVACGGRVLGGADRQEVLSRHTLVNRLTDILGLLQ